MHTNRASLIILLQAIWVLSGCDAKPQIQPGIYYGYEPMGSLSPEKPDAFWYHELTMTVTGKSVRIEREPYCLVDGQVISSASDGGYEVLEGTIELLGGRTIFTLHLVSRDYMEGRFKDPFPANQPRQYLPIFAENGSFELDRVIYTNHRDPKLAWTPRT